MKATASRKTRRSIAARDRFRVACSLAVPAAPGVEVRVLKERVIRAAACCSLSAGRLDLVIVGDERMAELHERFSGVPGTTDVLTFDLRDGEAGPVEGEVYLCYDEALRRSRERDHPVADELLLYAVHGLLHLLGYDDHDPGDHRRMHAEEDRILESIGVGRVFAAPKKGRA